MISRIRGKLVEKKDFAALVDVNGMVYEIAVPVAILQRLDEMLGPEGHITLETYHYWQLTPSSGTPVLIGFSNAVERDFFLQFISVSGIGPKAAVKAINKSIAEIAKAIDQGDLGYLKTLPGIGAQRAKEIVAKLQGKVGKFGLIQDHGKKINPATAPITIDWQAEALEVLLQLQYKRPEAADMIAKAVERRKDIQTAEELLNEIYKQRIKGQG
ncbi:MAG: hypothetical protein HQL23_06700 [Candidatus Omnitrophica bacterium]|nr:hypothetical protein [Candidatus Omnitrophota bacterium]